MRLLAIDPGPVVSAHTIINMADRKPLAFGILPNEDTLALCCSTRIGPAYIEMVASYGMPVGAEVFDTCVWIGRFQQSIIEHSGEPVELVKRQAVRMHLCHNGRLAKDSNVIQALRDRFAYGQPNFGKGTKAEPGWFHGFTKDVWQSYALAVYAADLELDEVPF